MIVLLALAHSAAAQSCDRAAQARGVVINEFLIDPDSGSSDVGYEWVEILNTSSGTVDLSGWVIASGTSTFGESDPFPGGTSLRAGALLLVGQSMVPDADVTVDGFSLGNASDADAVQLRDCVGGAVDTIVYGSPNENGWVGDGGDRSLAPKPAAHKTLGRSPDGRDTDHNATDLVELPYETPGEPNDAPPIPCGGPGSGFVVNEIYPNPTSDEGDYHEWVELLHTGSSPIDLTGWSIVMGTSTLTKKYTWESGTVRPGERLLVGGLYVPGADILLDQAGSILGDATSSSDVVAILDCKDFASDTLVYGGPNEGSDTTPPFNDDTGEVATRLAPRAGDGESIQRAIDGRDTDDNQVDWVVTTEPSPGAPNPRVEPVKCVPSRGDVTINEFLPDPPSTDTGLEWLELYNAGDAPASVAGWALSFSTSESFDTRQVTFQGGIEIPAKGFLVVGGESVEEATIPAAFSIGNGTETDGIRLFDCEGAAVDTVLYGDEPNLGLLTDDAGEIAEPYGDPGTAEALARVTDGVDTDTSADWKITAITTPGASNVRDVGDLEDPLADAPGTGCSKAPPEAGTGPQPTDPDGGCGTGPRAPMLLVPLAALLARRRGR